MNYELKEKIKKRLTLLLTMPRIFGRKSKRSF